MLIKRRKELQHDTKINNINNEMHAVNIHNYLDVCTTVLKIQLHVLTSYGIYMADFQQHLWSVIMTNLV